MSEFVTPRHADASRVGADNGIPSRVQPSASTQAAKSGQPLEDGISATMAGRFGLDFSHVRVHADSASAAKTQAMGALAHTTGSHISFGPGQYRPGTAFGRRLLTHELAHVVQQEGTAPVTQSATPSAPGDAAERAADAAALVFSRPQSPEHSVALDIRESLRTTRVHRPSVMRAVSTWAGEFETDKYDVVLDAAKKQSDGVDIALRFKPGKQVDAEEIGMVQMVTSRSAGKTLAVDKTVGARSIPDGKTGEGAHIDQLAKYGNPLYATGAVGAKDTIAATPTHAVWGQHGWRFTDKAGKVQQQDAILKDTPVLPGHGANSSQVFESTAVAVKGAQVGTWYGSVQWGWQSDATNTFTKLALSAVSKDVPTDTFGTAAGLWAANKTSTGAATLGLPMIVGKYANAADVPLLTDPAKFPAGEIGKLAKNSRLVVTDKGIAAAFNKNAKTQWWKATVTDGALIGRVGWVMETAVSDATTK